MTYSDLRNNNGDPIDKNVFGSYAISKVYVATLFGLLCGLVRQRNFSGEEALFKSSAFQAGVYNFNRGDFAIFSREGGEWSNSGVGGIASWGTSGSFER